MGCKKGGKMDEFTYTCVHDHNIRVGFNHLTELKDHYQEVHRDLKVKCKHCPHLFGNKYLRDQHNIHVHEKKNYQCYNCPRSFECPSDLDRHNHSTHKRLKYKCKDSDNVFKTERGQAKH
ncbi:zinc finger protein 660-like [Tripterygium wilfordii]|uniref:zinc finger protein 660-like n=1 Tax=Tripterygium wilfordii TaxID=458696 RepID=UPI0018F821A2|nr:zinc finger protein 660-like [Tripterygium wilfordii]